MTMLLNIKNQLKASLTLFVFLCLSILIFSCGDNAQKEEPVNATETEATEAPLTEAEQKNLELPEGEEPRIKFGKNPSIQEISDSLRISLSKKSLGFFSELIPMSEEKTYRDGSATLVRKYDWDVSFPVTVSMGDVLVFPKRGTDKILVTINKLKIGKRFSFGSETETTVTNEGWVTESSRDQDFWKNMDKLSKEKMAKAVFNNKKVTNRLRNKAVNLVITEINETLAGTGAADNQFEFIIQRISY